MVAGLAGISEDYLSQIERGMKTPSTTLLHSLARILGVPVAALLGEPVIESGTYDPPLRASELNAALVSYGNAIESDDRPDLPDLRARVESAWLIWQSSPRRYSETGPLLPGIVRDVEGAVRSLRRASDAQMRREACRIAADLYFLLRTYTKRIGRTDLSLLVADRAIRAAEDADDPLRIAAAKWNLGQVLLAANESEAAEDTAIRAAEELANTGGTEQQQLALHGALWLVATIAAVRSNDPWTARDRLRRHARPAAEQAGEGNAFWTVFGPINVGLHAVSIEMETGEAAEALRLADEIELGQCPSVERRATFSLEIARCYEQRREDTGVLLHLLDAEREAPEDMRYNALARDLVRGLMRRARPTMASQVRGLASRIDLFE